MSYDVEFEIIINTQTITRRKIHNCSLTSTNLRRHIRVQFYHSLKRTYAEMLSFSILNTLLIASTLKAVVNYCFVSQRKYSVCYS